MHVRTWQAREARCLHPPQNVSAYICTVSDNIISSYLLNEAWPGSCELGAAVEPAGA